MQKANETLNLKFRNKLREELARRMRSNELYSLRAFAQSLEVDSSTLSKILAGKRFLSEKKINSLCQKLGLKIFSEEKEPAFFSELDQDIFASISDWYHFAILDLTLLQTFKSDIAWMAERLGLQSYEVLGAVERLKRLGLLIEENGQLRKAQAFYTNYSEGDTSAALKEYQRQIIKKALKAVDDCAAENKDITSITIAADSKKLKEAKERIKIFRRELCQFLEDGERDSVFHLTLQLYPVTDIENQQTKIKGEII